MTPEQLIDLTGCALGDSNDTETADRDRIVRMDASGARLRVTLRDGTEFELSAVQVHEADPSWSDDHV